MPTNPAAPSKSDPKTACVLCRSVEAHRLFVKEGWIFARCRGCGLVSLRPLPTPDEIEANHEASYLDGRYADFAAADAIREAISRHRFQVVSALAPEGPWLDVGCSTGSFIAEVARAGIPVEGVELSEAAVARARARGLSVHHGTEESFVPTGRYAAVTAFDLIEHLPDPVAFVRRVSTWLLSGGLFALTLPDAASLPARLMRRHWYYYAPPDHVHYFTPSTIRRLLEENGFHEVTTRRAHKPMTLDYAFRQLQQFNPRLSRMLTPASYLVPRGLRSRMWPIPVGEMMVTARVTSS